MKSLTIKRAKVIKALKTEPLRAGSFFFDDKEEWENNESVYTVKPINQSIKTCEVCAVGAVLRNHLKPSVLSESDSAQELGELATFDQYVESDVEKLIKEGNYLGALSSYFEKLMDTRKNVTPFVRQKCVDFVKKNFPVEFHVNLQKARNKRKSQWY